MVTLYVAGKPVGTLAEADALLSELAAQHDVEVRDDSGKVLGRFVPAEPLIPWEPDITRDEIERRIAEPGLTLDEVRARLGWK